jgi:hypothetical protein
VKEWNEAEAQKTVAELIRRAMTDRNFRVLALSDPPAAIAKINPTPLPPGFKVQIVAKDGADMTIVVPDLIPQGSELSDAELEQVAGGGANPNRCGMSCVASCQFTSVF